MNKTELITAVAQEAEMTKKDAEKAVKAVIDVVSGALSGGKDRAPAHDHRACEQKTACYEKDSLRLVLLQNEPGRPYDNECSK